MLTVAGESFGSTTVTGDLMLGSSGTLALDTGGAGGALDLLTVSGDVTLSGTLALTQTTMPDGTVILIDGASLTGTFATTTGLVNGALISQTITYDNPSGQVRLVTTVMIPVPMPDPEFPTGCTATPTSPLAAGGTLTCISGSPITEAIATTVDGVSIIIGESATQTTVMTASGDAVSATIADTSAAGNISINSAFGIISGGANGIVASTAGSGSITITAASVTGTTGDGIYVGLANDAGSGAITVTATGVVSGGASGISASNAGSGTTSITAASVSSTTGVGILTRTIAGASITVNAGGTVSGGAGMSAIETGAIDGDSSSTPADSVTIMGTVSGNIMTFSGADSVTLAAGSTTTGITIDLGEGDDTLDLASAAFGTLDAGAGADTLSVTGTGITLDAGAVSGFETLTFAAGGNTLSGDHDGLTNTNFNAGVTTLSGTLTSATATIAAAGGLDLADAAEVTGDLANSGALEVAGTATGAATVTGDLTLNAGSTLTLDTAGMGNDNDLLTVSGDVTLGGTLVLRQASVATGTVTLINGATSLSGDFDTVTGLRDGVLVSQSLFQDATAFDLQLITVAATLDPDDQTHTGCVVLGGGTLMAGGTLNCISAEALTQTIFTNVDGVTINVGSDDIPTTINVASDSDSNTSDEAIRALVGFDGTVGITIDASNGTLTGADNGIFAYSAGTGGISITAASVTGTTG